MSDFEQSLTVPVPEGMPVTITVKVTMEAGSATEPPDVELPPEFEIFNPIYIGDAVHDELVVATESEVTSRTLPAVSMVESPSVWYGKGWAKTAETLRNCAGAFKIHIQPFGLLDPWASDVNGPTESAPTLWKTGNRLFTGLNRIRECGDAPIILTAYGGCWWQKGKLSQDGKTTTLMTASEAYSDSGRVMIDKLPQFLQVVDGAVDLAADAGCEDVEWWNEFKGYYSVPSGRGQTWDASYSAGNPGKADMGYSYAYEAGANQIIATMTRKQIDRQRYRISGPYPVFPYAGNKNVDALPADHPLNQYAALYGYANKAAVNATHQFLGYVRDRHFPFDALSIDMNTGCRDGYFPSADPFVYIQRFEDMVRYWRSVLPDYGIDPDLPIDFSELYPSPTPDLAANGTLRLALWADAFARAIRTRVRYVMIWGCQGNAQGNYGLIDHRDRGNPTALAGLVGFVRDRFGPGTAVYETQSANGLVGGLATDSHLLCYNKRGNPLRVLVGGKVESFAPYETKMLER